MSCDWFSSANLLSIICSIEFSSPLKRPQYAMSARFEQAELLKKQYTDKYVVVKPGVPELRRFDGLTGVVKTVNMSCRALVLFDGPADIGWYDIDPAYLTVVDAPIPKKKSEEKPTKESPAAKSAPAAKPAAASEKKASPLDLIRQQGAAGAKPAAAPAAGGAKPSPLDLIRQQGAAKAAGTVGKPAAAPTTASSGEGKKLSPIEMIRQQQATKAEGATPAAAPVAEAPKPAAPAAADGKKLSPLELIRMQGAFKGNK